MARILGPDFVALQVWDVEASAQFYEDAVVFATEPVPFAVRRPVADLDAVERLGWGAALWMRCDGAQALYESSKEAGVRIAREPFDGPFGRTFAFVDPDGYGVTAHGA